MAYAITVDPNLRRVLIVGSGQNNLASSLAAMDELAARDDVPRSFSLLCDFRANEYTPGSVDSQKLADAYSSRFAGRPMAIVVSGLLHYGVANMITTIVRLRGNPVAAFRELAEAERWLQEEAAKTSAEAS